MPQHSYKQLEEAYQKGVNKEHKPNPARTHPMSSQQGKGCPQIQYPKQHLHHHLANMNMSKYLFDWHRHQHTSKN